MSDNRLVRELNLQYCVLIVFLPAGTCPPGHKHAPTSTADKIIYKRRSLLPVHPWLPGPIIDIRLFMSISMPMYDDPGSLQPHIGPPWRKANASDDGARNPEPCDLPIPDDTSSGVVRGSSCAAHMSSSLKCPIEILERVVDLIWEDPDELDFWSNYGDEYRTLCALALSCQHLLPRSRFNLLRRVSLLKMSHLRSFAKTIAHHPHYGDIVRELVILSTGISEDKDPKEPAELSPAESFAVLLANRLPKLRTLRIRTEVDPDMSLNSRPSLYFHPAALASLRSFSSVSHLQLFGLRFREFSDFLHIIQALHGLVVLQCMQIWFRKSLKKDPPPRVSLKPVPKLQTIDLAFIPRSGMKRLLEGLHPGSLRELIITPNTVSSADEAKNTFGSLSQFVHLETFSFFVAVTAKGAEYTDVVALLELVKPHRSLRTVTISHYLHGPDRRHVVPKQTLIDALRRNADMLQAALVPRTFSEDTQIVFQFQGLHGSEGWWEDQLELILPNIFAPTNSPGRRFFRVANVTYSDWSPWADDKDLSAPT